jgi:hypothetical protein
MKIAMQFTPKPDAAAPVSSDVYRFWNTEACGTQFVSGAPASREFFRQYRAFRDATEENIEFHMLLRPNVSQIGTEKS